MPTLTNQGSSYVCFYNNVTHPIWIQLDTLMIVFMPDSDKPFYTPNIIELGLFFIQLERCILFWR